MKKILLTLSAVVFAGVANAQVVEDAEGVTKNEPITILDILMAKDNGTVVMEGNIVEDDEISQDRQGHQIKSYTAAYAERKACLDDETI